MKCNTRVTEDAIYGFFDEYRFLSNFHVAPVIYQGIEYPSSEHAYQAAKTLDENIRREFAALPTPNDAKHKGKKLKNIRPDWESIKYKVMYDIVFDKFIRNHDLKEKLLATGRKHLEETNWWGDKTWGVYNGIGKNWLGKILMIVRSELAEL